MNIINLPSVGIPDRIKLATIATDAADTKWPMIGVKSNDLRINDKRILQFTLCLVEKGHTVKEQGNVDLEIDARQYVYIKSLKNWTHDHDQSQSSIKGIGKAGLEIAIRISFIVGKEGKIRLFTAFSSAFFYYKCGMRFIPSHESFCPSSNLRAPIRNYLEAKEEGTKDRLQKEITSHEDFDLFKETLFDNVKENLGREPKNFEELLRFGLFLDLNKYMEKKITARETPDQLNEAGKYKDCPRFFTGKDMHLPSSAIAEKLIEYNRLYEINLLLHESQL